MSLKLVILLFLFIYVANASIKLQLNHHESQLQRLLKANLTEEYRALKIKHNKALQRSFSDPGKSKISDYQGEVFTVGISVRTPSQKFDAIVDTSSQLTRVFSQKRDDDVCDNCLNCEKVKCFDSNASTTYVKPDEPSSKSIIPLGIDTITLGDPELDQLVVTDVTFGQDVEEPYYFDPKKNVNGVLGLGLKSIIESGEIVPIFYKARMEGLIRNPVFTIYLNPQGNLSTGFLGGQLTFGDFDKEHCSLDHIFQLTTRYDAYNFKIDGYGLNGGINTMKKYVASLSSVTTNTYVPYEVLYQLIDATKATYNYDYGEYQVQCDTKFNVSIIIDNNQITIDEKVGIINIYDNVCFLAIEQWNRDGIDFVLGTNFMRQWCTSYDLVGRVSFSKALL